MSAAIQAPLTHEHQERLRRVVQGERPGPPVAQLLGISLTHIELGRSIAELSADPLRHANPMGTLHGGVACDLGDLAMGTALATTLEDDETFTTLDLSVKYFKPIWKSHLRATATVIKRTRKLGLIECDIEDEGGSLVAKLWSSCMVLRGQDAQGR